MFLIAWRKYSAIGAGEIERAREEFLRRPGADLASVDAEYRDALERLRDAKQAERAWYRQAGLYKSLLNRTKSQRAERLAVVKLRTTRPTTPAGAAAFIRFVIDEMAIGDADWHSVALRTIAEALEGDAGLTGSIAMH